MNKFSIAYYGDDFTGSTDVLETLSKAGLKTVLFLDIPTSELLAQFPDLEALGIAGLTRAMTPTQMEAELLPAFEAFKSLSPSHVHYKVCSTFDSSAEIGNLGVAISCGQKAFGKAIVPILVAAPHMGRYSAFGNLYARMGAGSMGAIYRLDRHPSMSKHPSTPANESDLRLHLAEQSKGKSGLIDLVDLEGQITEILQKIDRLTDEGTEVLFFDAMYDHQLAKIGETMEILASKSRPLFSLGSSGIEKALCNFWLKKEKFKAQEIWKEVSTEETIIVLSGSCSPITGNQISWALKNGFEEIIVDPEVLDQEYTASRIADYAFQMVEAISCGKSVIMHTCKGPDDPRLAQSKTYPSKESIASRYGRVLGTVARIALEQVVVKRMVIAGGDTSGYVAKNLGIEAVEMISPIYPGAPLCVAYARNSPANKMQINLKGGQVGEESYFELLRKGNSTNTI